MIVLGFFDLPNHSSPPRLDAIHDHYTVVDIFPTVMYLLSQITIFFPVGRGSLEASVELNIKAASDGEVVTLELWGRFLLDPVDEYGDCTPHLPPLREHGCARSCGSG
jgi:hypothetical protein